MDFPFLFFAAFIIIIAILLVGLPFITAGITYAGLTGTSATFVGVLGLLLSIVALWALAAPLFHL
jgi:hypothetical protein